MTVHERHLFHRHAKRPDTLFSHMYIIPGQRDVWGNGKPLRFGITSKDRCGCTDNSGKPGHALGTLPRFENERFSVFPVPIGQGAVEDQLKLLASNGSSHHFPKVYRFVRQGICLKHAAYGDMQTLQLDRASRKCIASSKAIKTVNEGRPQQAWDHDSKEQIVPWPSGIGRRR